MILYYFFYELWVGSFSILDGDANNFSLVAFGYFRPTLSEDSARNDNYFFSRRTKIYDNCFHAPRAACGKGQDRLGCLEYILYFLRNIGKDGAEFRSAMMEY